MTDSVLLLRGVNVGGAGKLAMADLRALLGDLGARGVKTYIQSGNAVFSGRLEASSVEAGIEARFGFRPRAWLLTRATLAAVCDGFPFRAAEGRHGHVWFLAGPGAPDLAAMEALAGPGEDYAMGDGVFYLHAPNGIGRSKLAAKAERLLGIAATSRNLNTLRKLCDMARP